MDDQSSGSVRIEKLTASNFYIWKQKIELLLALRDVDQYVFDDISETATSDDRRKWIRGDAKAKAVIGLTLSDDYLQHVRGCSSAKETWEAILNVFERHTLLNKLSARRDFYTVSMLPSEKVLVFINRVKQIAARLQSMSVEIDDKEIAMAVLNGLPPRFDNLIVALDALGNEDKVFGLDFVKSRLLQEEQRESMKTASTTSPHAPALVNRMPIRRDMRCTNCNRHGHTAARCWGKDVNGRRPAPPDGFRSRNPGMKPSAFVSRDETSTAAFAESDFTCLLSTSSPEKKAVNAGSWLVDSGCSAHITFDRSLFVTYEQMQSGSVEMGTKARANVAGRGEVEFMLNVNGSPHPCKLSNVLHVPDFGYSLLSVSQIVSKGLQVSFEKDKCIVTAGPTVVATASQVGDLFILDVMNETFSAHVVTLQTLHERMAHVNVQGIASMIHNNVVSGINVRQSDVIRAMNRKSDNHSLVCPACVFGKATRSVIPKQRSSSRAQNCLDLVHSDVCGPLEVQSIGGSRYFITFVDDHSNWVVVYTMRNKSEAFAKYKLYEQFAQTHTGRKVKVLRTDRGGEYLSTEFKSYLDSNGTQHQLTTAYTPEQNGVAERLNRTLIDLVRSMLSHKQVSKRFWAEALATAVYVRNRVTSRALPVNTTPHHIWMKSTPNVGHLRVFGSKCWYTLPKLELRKLDLRAREAMFLGYSQCSKAYKLWDGELSKVVVSRDAKFDESTCGMHDIPAHEKDSISSDVGVVLLGGDNENEADTPNANEVGSEEDEISGEVIENEDTHSVGENDEDDVSPPVETPNVTPPTPTPAVRRSSRISRPPGSWWRSNFAAALLSHAHVAIEGPKTFKQATHGPRAAFWQTGIDKELASQTKNQTWKLVPRSEASNILTSRWVFNVKQLPDANGNIVESAKARLVARGFQQVQGLDYTETYAPVIKFTTIRLLLALVAHYDLELHQMDAVTAFLNGDLDEDIYMEQPEGCVDKSKSDHVCKLLKALYGLKQAPCQWHTKVDDFLLGELGFETSRSDPCLYIKRIGNTIMLIALYVDDLLLAGSDIHAIKWMKGELNKRFEMKDLSEAKVCIGLEIHRDRTIKTLSLTQTKYALNVLDRFKMSTCNPSLTPMEQGRKTTNSIENDSETKVPYREAVGCLMYLMVGTRPDLAYAIGKLSQHSANPCESHWAGVKRVMRYVQGTRNLGIVFDNKSKSPELLGFSDADWAGCSDSRKSTSGYVFKFCGGAISWSSRKQTVVATSTCEAEYIALCEACKEATWLRQVVADVLGLDSDPTIMMGCDNAGTISFAQNESINRRNKRVDVKYHYVRDAIKRNIVYLSHCPTTSMPADILTKALGRILFQKFVELLGLAVSSKSM
ncbi:Retrovirus-related Gag-Pol polyprotein [Chondrus crispus]|uniref:Retrovirus-related Gag-Pol polyprotein n=1 Tax=Chondrus crispus TaxID=2769 RepID=S0F303_CHOCR|nr:Retrovirus-related Gag-Pol polyprotein [Chondrus crispus]CDF77556.1 Retrovirus-related Gag-Pol polyprotein [Chondrus crispus]|eukprot:XP_005717340.1 Retrovirus-related Gag-Pol polyprotein [Chondrus crispus]